MPTEDNAPKPRTIDERLDGVTQTLEIIAAMQRDNERGFAETNKRFQENEIRFAAIASNIGDLVKVAQLHEHRLTRLEGDSPQ